MSGSPGAAKRSPSIASIVDVDKKEKAAEEEEKPKYEIPTEIPYPDDFYPGSIDMLGTTGDYSIALPITTRLPIASGPYAVQASPCFVTRSEYHCWLDNPYEHHFKRAHFQVNKGLSWSSRRPAVNKSEHLLYSARNYDSRYRTLPSTF